MPDDDLPNLPDVYPPTFRSLADLHRELQSPNLYERWHIARTDELAKPILIGIEKLWQSWPAALRHWLVHVVEYFVQATDQRTTAPQMRGRYEWIAERAVAQLSELRRWLRAESWLDENAYHVLFDLQLASVVAALEETSITNAALSRRVIYELLRTLFAQLEAGGHSLSLALLAQLIWLAEGRRRENPLDESTIRYYLEPPPPTKSPTAKQWQSVWADLWFVWERMPIDWPLVEVFRLTIRRYLAPPPPLG